MDFQQLIESITPEIYNNLKTAVELGKWPDGSRLTPEQREHSIQAVIAYDARHKAQDDRVGDIPPQVSNESCRTKDKGVDSAPDAEQPIKWQDNL
jgi:uncharacterized protein YeaC (DUF1315 family)